MSRSEKEIWVDDVMNSLDGMQRVAAPAGMYDGVMARLANRGDDSRRRRLLPRVAVAAAVLLAVNIASVYHASRKAAMQQQNISQSINQQISDLENGF